MINRYGFAFGFEIEVNGIWFAEASKIVVKLPYWNESPDGNGWEFKTREAFTDLDRFMAEAGSLITTLKDMKARVHTADSSPRGIHIHLSHPTRVISNRQIKHANALRALWPTTWSKRESYCVWRVSTPTNGTAKYSAINAFYDGSSRRIEIRAYNSTLNLRAISQMMLNAQEVANVLFEDEGFNAEGKRIRQDAQTPNGRTPRPRRRRTTDPIL